MQTPRALVPPHEATNAGDNALNASSWSIKSAPVHLVHPLLNVVILKIKKNYYFEIIFKRIDYFKKKKDQSVSSYYIRLVYRDIFLYSYFSSLFNFFVLLHSYNILHKTCISPIKYIVDQRVEFGIELKHFDSKFQRELKNFSKRLCSFL